MTPREPSETTIPSKFGSPRNTRSNEPSAETNSSPATAVARLPFLSPDPWVPVAIAPATVMWGRDARLWTAQPAEWSAVARSP
jgi:hypothetical protein